MVAEQDLHNFHVSHNFHVAAESHPPLVSAALRRTHIDCPLDLFRYCALLKSPTQALHQH